MSEELETVDQDRIDQIIWKHIGLKPVREIADLAGVKPEEILRRKNQLLEETDVLTVTQKRQRLVIELDGMARNMRERAEASVDEFASGMINSSIAAMKIVLAELARAEKADNTKIEQLNALRVRELLRLVDATIVSSVQDIAEQYDLPEEDLMTIFQSRMVEAAQELDAS